MSVQNLTDYVPTKTEEKLLNALLDPRNRLLSVTEVCKIADISRDTYYRIFDNEAFEEYYKKLSQSLAIKHVSQVMNSFTKEATRGSFQHGKIILEMAGLYKETKRQEHTGKDGGPIETTSLTPEERKARIDELISKRGAGTTSTS